MNNLKMLRKRKGVAQKDVAQYLGVTPAAYGQYELNKRSMNPDVLTKLSDYFGVSIDTILGRDQEPFGRQIVVQPVPDFEDEVQIPIVASLQCGYGMAGDPFTIIGHESVPRSYIQKYGKDICFMYAVGNSMFPTIKPGDLMLCCPTSWWDDGMVCIVNIDDVDTVKRVYHAKDGGIDLVPDNPRSKSRHYSPEEIEDMGIHVTGHVIRTVTPELEAIPRRKED